MSDEVFSSVWDAIEDTPEEAQNMKLRSALMSALDDHIRANGWTHQEAARRPRVTQLRISDLMRGKIDLFVTFKPGVLAPTGTVHRRHGRAWPDHRLRRKTIAIIQMKTTC